MQVVAIFWDKPQAYIETLAPISWETLPHFQNLESRLVSLIQDTSGIRNMHGYIQANIPHSPGYQLYLDNTDFAEPSKY